MVSGVDSALLVVVSVEGCDVVDGEMDVISCVDVFAAVVLVTVTYDVPSIVVGLVDGIVEAVI